MEEKDMLKLILSSLSDIIVVEDKSGSIHYQNHPEIDYTKFTNESKVNDEFYDEDKKRWYKLSTTTFDIENRRFVLKKYGHVTKMKKQQTMLEKDGKTGLLRPEIFKQKVEYLSSLNKNMMFVLIDIDYFKKINDCYGHDVGDDVLSKIGLLIKSIFRGSDLLGRFGGDELILALVEIDFNKSLEKLELLRESITNIELGNYKETYNVTVSIGFNNYNNELSYDENLNKVDEALYFSKNNGRNQVNYLKDVKVKKLKK